MRERENSSVIELRSLTKAFGSLVAVDNLSLSVSAGEVLGFLGPNGAGKTTTMRMLTGLIAPTSGSATIKGFDIRDRKPEMLAEIGYLPGTLALYETMSARDFFNFLARMRSRDCSAKIGELAERLKLDLRPHIHELSKGNRQKVGVISAFIHEPSVLILDEPTSGLDPLMQREFECMLDEVKSRGAAVLLSSHVMSEVENLSDRVAILHQGRLLLLDTVTALKLKALQRAEFHFDKPVSPSEFESVQGVKSVKAIANRIVIETTGNQATILRTAADLGAISVRTEEPSLDEIFLALLANGGSS